MPRRSAPNPHVRAKKIGIGFHVVAQGTAARPPTMFGPPITRRRGAGGCCSRILTGTANVVPNLCNGFVLAAVGFNSDFEVVSGRRLIAKSHQQSLSASDR